MSTITKNPGQVKRLVLEIGGTPYLLDESVTKEEALSALDILSQGITRIDYIYSDAGSVYFAEQGAEVALRSLPREIHASRFAAKQAADAAAAAAKEAAL